MVDEKVKAPAKKKATSAEKPTVKKTPVAKKEAAPKKAAAPVKAEKPAAASGKTVTLVQTGSPIGRQEYQRATLIGLGLNKLNRTRTLQDTPSVRGMIEKVKHLVKIVEA